MKNKNLELLVDSHHGIYVPKVFVEQYDLKEFGFNDDDIAYFEKAFSDPDNDEYYDAWDKMERNAITKDGSYLTTADGDLWLVPKGYTYDDLFLAKGGGVADIDYSDVYPILKEKIDNVVDEISYENVSQGVGEEVEHRSRDGFWAYTNGGYEYRWFEYVGMLNGSGKSLPTKPLDAELDRQVQYNYDLAKETFIERYPEIVEELGEDKINYRDLQEAGYSSEAEELSEMEMEYNGEDSVMMRVMAYYYNPENSRNKDGKHTISLFGDVNLESPYHRVGNLDDSIELTFTFNSLADLSKKMDTNLKKVLAWFDGDYYKKSKREMKVRRMEDGGEMAWGGFVTNLKDAYGSDSMLDELKSKMKEGEPIVAFAYTDYGGDFFDKVAIDYFIENYPDNIVWENTGWNGKNGIVFGEPAREFLQEADKYLLGFDDIESYYYEKEREEEYESFKYFLKDISSDYRVSRKALDWLLENRSGYYGMTTQGLDFSYSDLENALLEEGLITKKKMDGGMMARGGKVVKLTEKEKNQIRQNNERINALEDEVSEQEFECGEFADNKALLDKYYDLDSAFFKKLKAKYGDNQGFRMAYADASDNYADGGMMANGGEIVDYAKEVAEKNQRKVSLNKYAEIRNRYYKRAIKSDMFADTEWNFHKFDSELHDRMNIEGKESMAKGGKAKYIPNDEIESITTTSGKVIKGSSILDGAYVRKSVKLMDGGDVMARGGVERIANSNAREYTENMIPFKGNNLEAKTLDNGDYVVLSYGYYPIWWYCKKESKWYGNKDKYSMTTAKHISQSRPTYDATMLSKSELTDMMMKHNASYEMGGLMGTLMGDVGNAPTTNVGGTTFSSASLTPQMDITSPNF